MSIPISNAVSAYTNSVQLMEQATGQKSLAPQAQDATGSFANMVTDALTQVVESGRSAEHKASEVVQGQGNIVDVVTAVAETEVALQAVVAVRDRVISAYEEIMRMPI